jgi:Ca2+-binding EF-hand superfamily protein
MPSRPPIHALQAESLFCWCCLLLVFTASALAQQTPFRPSPASESAPRVPGFGPLQGQRTIPGFGPEGATQVALLPEDLAKADDRMQRYDSNRDGYLDRNEIGGGRWSDDPFQFDGDRDGRLSRLELARRYSLRRLAESGGGMPPPSTVSVPAGTSPSADEQQRRDRERRAMEEAARARGALRGTRESWHLTETLMSRHDINRDGVLDANERRSLGLPAAADLDRDQRVSRPELSAWLAQQESLQGRAIPRELPAWFVEKDKDGDGQIQMSEFADQWTDELYDEFSALDLNNDGIIVADECLQSLHRLQEEYTNQRFQLIPVKGVIRSDIEVKEDRRIADLDVQLQITHTHDDHLNVFLIGADGQRVELFTGVGGNDDHFDNTILDEESPHSILRARPPFAGRYQTEELSRGGKGLKKFYNGSMAGTWTLLVEANSDRPGVLHGWSLIFRRVEEAPGATSEQEFD